MDHTGGGPTLGSTTGTLGPSPTASTTLRRWIKPLTPQFVGTMPVLDTKPGAETPVDFIEVTRPLMFYPAVMFAGYKYNGKDAITELMSMADEINANPPTAPVKATEPGLPDPDVDRVEITVLVQTLTQDLLAKDGPFMVLYTTTRAMPADLKAKAHIPLKWTDEPNIWNPTEAWNNLTTYLLLPRARTLRLRINALCRDEPQLGDPYFGADDVRRGPQLIIPLRKNALTEPELFVKNPPSYTINGFFLQPTLDATSQLATALGLRSKDTSLRAPGGKRVVFACGSSIMHVLGPDRASLTFASQSSLALQWIIVIRLTMERDWSWDGFPVDGISVKKGTQDVVIFAPNQNANEDAVSGPAPDRSSTVIVIVDVIEPKLPPGVLPIEMHIKYTLAAKFLAAANTTSEPAMDLSIDLPVTTAPTQIPQLGSVGLAMSPYVHDDGYTSTLPRTKMLWVEFASPLDDPQDRYFCRILKYAPDPLLLGDQFFPISTTEDQEPPIPLDPEPARRIVPLQSLDTAGLDAMQLLVPTSSPLHWGLPLPPGLTPDSLDLFGFWTYEFRVGHWNDKTHTRWSTAQARFGPAYRVTGVQHPAPPLLCSLSRDAGRILVSARFAQPTRDGKPLVLKLPTTEMWFLLYAQAAQMDGSGERRNILVARQRGSLGEGGKESVAGFSLREVNLVMGQYGLRPEAGLSAMAAEMVGQPDFVTDPLGGDLGRQRILRTSCLVAVPGMC